MININLELWPKGDESAKTHLGTIKIWNDLSSDDLRSRGNYQATLSKRGQPDRVWKSTAITGFPRRTLGAYDLLYRVLKSLLSDRNP